jgi:hypothetical protein
MSAVDTVPDNDKKIPETKMIGVSIKHPDLPRRSSDFS